MLPGGVRRVHGGVWEPGVDFLQRRGVSEGRGDHGAGDEAGDVARLEVFHPGHAAVLFHDRRCLVVGGADRGLVPQRRAQMGTGEHRRYRLLLPRCGLDAGLSTDNHGFDPEKDRRYYYIFFTFHEYLEMFIKWAEI